MKIAVIGTGYVGLSTGISLCIKGHSVKFFDSNKKKIDGYKNGKITFYEKGMEEALKASLKNKRASFTTSLEELLEDSEIVFICIGVKNLKDKSQDLEGLAELIEQIKKLLDNEKIIAIKSTINPLSYLEIKKSLNESKIHLAANPEFLREGYALQDALEPLRIVVGTEDKYSKEKFEKLYSVFDAPKIFTDPISALVIKYAANSFLGVKISYINEIANLCEKIGGNIDDVSLGLGLDPRIGRDFLKAGIGFGGSCLPKDIKNFIKFAELQKSPLTIIESAEKVNRAQYKSVIEKLEKHLSSLGGKTIAVFGLSFKAGTDDLRESLSLKIIQQLEKKGAIVRAQDFLSFESARTILKKATVSDDPYVVAENSNAIIITTEDKQYQNLDWKRIKKLMIGNVIIDGRNILDSEKLKKIGFIYEGIGRR